MNPNIRRWYPRSGVDLARHSEWDTAGHRGEVQHLLLLPALQSGHLPAAPPQPGRLRVQQDHGQTVAQGETSEVVFTKLFPNYSEG